MPLVPVRYLPKALTKKDRREQIRYLAKSRKMYRKGIFWKRPVVKSFTSRPSKHVANAEKMYGVSPIMPNRALANATKCSVKALQKIVNKGAGAYYSSGSRPNQTAQSWGIARLASAITGGKAAAVDFGILEKGCDHRRSRAYKLAERVKGSGQRHTKRVRVKSI